MIETGPGLPLDLVVVTLGAFVLAMVLEMVRPAREAAVSAARWLNNGGLALVTYVSNHFLGTVLAVAVVTYLGPGIGLGLSGLPLWLELPLVFLALELVRYLMHAAMHKVPLLWRLHAVHHSDSEVDLSTAFRHHPFESLLMALPLTAVTLLLSGSPQTLLLYRAWDLVMAVFTHTNTELPQPIERWLRCIVVTPAFHRTHHMADKRFTDSNYGAATPWFDYLFRTHQSTTDEEQQGEALGLDTHTPNEQRLDGMLLAPFVTRRP